MKKIAPTLLAAITALSPLHSSANEQFATVEASVYFEGHIITTSLYAVGWQEPVDEAYIFEGISLMNGTSVPIRISVPLELDLPGDLPEQVQIEDVELALVDRFGFETDSAFVEKYLYASLGGPEGNVILTDDPIPLAVWLLVAGAAAITAPIIICVYENAISDEEERQTLEGEVTVNRDGITIGTSCEF